MKFWDSESATPFAIRNTQVITYDDDRSIYEKVKFAMEKKLAGIMVRKWIPKLSGFDLWENLA